MAIKLAIPTILLFVLTFTICIAGKAADITSTMTGGLWSDPSSWVGGVVPMSGDNVTIADGATITIDVSPMVGDLTVGEGSSGILGFDASASNVLTVSGNFTINANATFNPFYMMTGRTVNIGGNFIIDGSAVFDKVGTTITMNGTSAQRISGSGDIGTNSPMYVLEINNLAGVTLGRSLTITYALNLFKGVFTNGTDLTMDNTASLISPTACYLQRGVGSLSDPIIVGAMATYNLSYVVFPGTTNAAVVAGNEIPASKSISRLTIENSLGVTINSDLTLTSADPLAFNDGIITLGAFYNITCSNSAYNGTQGTTTSFVQGGGVILNWTGTSSKTFPIGSSGVRRYFSFNGMQGTGLFGMRVVDEKSGIPGTGLTALSHTRKWAGIWATGSFTQYGSVTIEYGDDDLPGSMVAADRRIAFSTIFTGAFSALGMASGTTSPITTSLINKSVLLNNIFTLGLVSGTLPITLEYFKGLKKPEGSNTVNWKVNCTSTRANMEIERSVDGVIFKSITTVTADQTRCLQPFSFTDINPSEGKNYYRLKMVDADDGKISYSPIIAILNAEKDIEIIGAFPTVVKNEITLNVTTDKTRKLDISISDMTGKIVKTYTQNIPEGSSMLKIDCSNLANGMYNISGFTENKTVKTWRFVK